MLIVSDYYIKLDVWVKNIEFLYDFRKPVYGDARKSTYAETACAYPLYVSSGLMKLLIAVYNVAY